MNKKDVNRQNRSDVIEFVEINVCYIYPICNQPFNIFIYIISLNLV